MSALTKVLSGKNYRNQPLPAWFLSYINSKQSMRYKDIIIPDVTLKVTSRDHLGGVGIVYFVNGTEIFGYSCNFPCDWTQSLTLDCMESGFQDKFSRHLNMLQKGASKLDAHSLKKFVDAHFHVNCGVSIRVKVNPTPIYVGKLPKNAPYGSIAVKGIPAYQIFGKLKKPIIKKRITNPSHRKGKI